MAKIIEVTAENKIDTRLFDSLLKEYRSAYEQKQKLHDLVIKSILSGAKKHHLEFGELEEVDDEGLFQFLQPNVLNPVLPENQEYVLRFAHELLTKYKFDGYALDYCRFPDAESDFSPASREAFETYLGHGIDRFPEDIFTYDANGARVAGPYYKQWWEFRSGVIRDFIAEVRTLIERTQPGVKLEYWAASWLHAIYTQGQNWASPRSRFHEAYLDDWATPTYNRTGFADLLDVFITGTYLEKVWGMDDPESIEYGLARSLKDVDGDCAVYGSLYAQNHVDQFEDAVYLCLSRTDGVMVFDIIQVIENDLWDDIKRGIDRAEKEQKTQK